MPVGAQFCNGAMSMTGISEKSAAVMRASQ
jgi:hypothetical protein